MADKLTARQAKQNLRTKFNIMYQIFYTDRSTFIPHWRDLSDFVAPRRPRYFITDVNRGDRRDQHILDSTATQAWETCVAGIMSSMTSPTRPWFKLGVHDPKLMERKDVQIYFEECEARLRDIFYGSNLYSVLPEVYEDVCLFATACAGMEEDFEGEVVRFRSFPIGSYFLANDENDRVRVFMREFEMTVRQLLEKFGERDSNDQISNWDHFSSMVQSFWAKNQLDVMVQVVHVIFPNQDFDPDKIEAKYKKYRSVYYERGIAPQHSTDTDDADYFLSDSGYDYFPILAPRWAKTGEDTYGTRCPGMVSLGDIRQLQVMEKRILMAAEKMVNPPLKADPSMRNQKVSMLPGDITYVSAREKGDSVAPMYEVKFDIKAAVEKQQETRERIRKNFYSDLFRMMTDSDRREITAYEVAEKKSEKLLMLGPMVENFNQDLLNPLVSNTFLIADRRGLMPKPPEALRGAKLKISYISIMAQAQKLSGMTSLQQFQQMVTQIQPVMPSISDRVDEDKFLEMYADTLGISPQILRSDEDTNAIRAQKAKMAQAQQAAEQAKNVASAAKDAGQTPVDSDNLLGKMIG